MFSPCLLSPSPSSRLTLSTTFSSPRSPLAHLTKLQRAAHYAELRVKEREARLQLEEDAKSGRLASMGRSGDGLDLLKQVKGMERFEVRFFFLFGFFSLFSSCQSPPSPFLSPSLRLPLKPNAPSPIPQDEFRASVRAKIAPTMATHRSVPTAPGEKRIVYADGLDHPLPRLTVFGSVFSLFPRKE